MGRLFLLLPVHIGKAPENRPIPKLLCQLQIVVAVFALGRAVKLRHFFAGGLLAVEIVFYAHIHRGFLVGLALIVDVVALGLPCDLVA